MAGKDCNALARGTIPYANRLIIGSGKLTRTFSQAGRLREEYGQSKASHDEIVPFGHNPNGPKG